MTRTFTAEYTFTLSAAAVHAALWNRDHWVERIPAVSEAASTLTDFRQEDQLVVVAASTEIASTLLPRGVGKTRAKEITFDFEERWPAWTGDRCEGTIHGAITLARMELDAVMVLTAGGADSAHMTLTGTVESRLPVFGKSVEEAVSTQFIEGFATSNRYVEEWIRRTQNAATGS
ncbi:DUF2505 domain-containing protein [Nocardia salmonicida]|uniref:DUF2505 domain-containing protein n=1 Tax=Nocardia salmonicida TaxID=53431 RepID=UPI0037A66219